MIFVFDLDDTVCETDSYSENYIADFIKKNNLPYKKIAKNVRFAEQKFNWDKKIALTWYREYGDQMMLQFPCKQNAINVINSLYDLGHTIIIATARANDWHSEPEIITKKWLKKQGIKYSKLYVGRVDKEKICEEENADVFLDDDINITKRVAEYFENKNSGQVYLMSTGYNKNLELYEGVIRVKNFKDFIKKVKSCAKHERQENVNK